jgi:hypothetical protein
MRSRLIGLLVTISSVGCSGSTDSHPSASAGSSGSVASVGAAGSSVTGGAGSPTNAGSPNGSGGSANSSSGGSAGSASVGPARWGIVQLVGLLGAGSGSTTQISARFGDPEHPQAQASSPCEVAAFGGCTVSTCAADYVAPNNSMVASPSAGKIAWSDGNMFSGELVPDAFGKYAAFASNTLGFSGGESLTVSAAGAAVPAFSTEVSVPLSLLLVSPPPDDTGHLVWAKTQDLVLTFDRGMPGLDLYAQSMSNDATNHTFLQCTLPSATGTATIPQAALAKLSTAHKILLTTALKRTLPAGDYSLEVWTVIGLLNQTKTYRIQLELQ